MSASDNFKTQEMCDKEVEKRPMVNGGSARPFYNIRDVQQSSRKRPMFIDEYPRSF